MHRTTAITAQNLVQLFRKHRIILVSALLVLILVPATQFTLFLTIPAGDGSRVELVELAKGRPLRSLASELEARHLVRSARLFTLYARLKGGASRVKAGTYQFNDGMHPGEILGKMIAGDVYQRLFALPTGYSTYQVAEMLEKRGIFGKDAFLAACRDRKLLAEMGIKADSAEGYLFTGTYNILPGKSEREVVREMVQRQQELLSAEMARVAGKREVSRNGLLTLASIVAKEAMLPAEMPTIAGVFQNRLKKGMRLQSDPTAVYGVRAFAGRVSHEDVVRPSPYNTYLIAGLPPGPIGNPSKEAIEAVLHHPRVPYLYFVARGDGSHAFSSDLATHNRAVRTYLRSAPPSHGQPAAR